MPDPTEPPAPTPEGPAATEAPVVAARDLHKRYGSGDAAVDALRGVTLELAPRTFTAIMGRSGSGKSTLMHLLAALDRPTRGEVWLGPTKLSELGDEDLTRLRRTRVGFVFQDFNLVPVLDVEENIVLPLRLAGRRVDRMALERLLGSLEISTRRHHRPAELSGGEQQRVAIARALITEPLIVFADEPTGNLDTVTSEAILRLLAEAVDGWRQTVVMVTHDPAAAAHADRVLFLDDGHLAGDHGRLTAAEVHDALKELE